MDQDNPFYFEEITPAFNDEWQAKRRMADAISQLTEALVTSSPSIEKMEQFAGQLEHTASEIEKSPRIFGRYDWTSSGEHGSHGQISHELNPIAGWSNPLAPPLNSWVEGDICHATCTCGWAYEGPPGSLHGGYVAALFDQFLGMVQLLADHPGMTAYLHVNYHERTPLNTELRLKGWYDKVEGRKNFIRGEMYANGVMTASAEGLFVAPREGIFALKAQEAALRKNADSPED